MNERRVINERTREDHAATAAAGIVITNFYVTKLKVEPLGFL